MPKSGVLHHKAKLDEDKVREIRRLRTEEGLSYVGIADRLNWIVDVGTIRAAAIRRTWRHVR